MSNPIQFLAKLIEWGEPVKFNKEKGGIFTLQVDEEYKEQLHSLIDYQGLCLLVHIELYKDENAIVEMVCSIDTWGYPIATSAKGGGRVTFEVPAIHKEDLKDLDNNYQHEDLFVHIEIDT